MRHDHVLFLVGIGCQGQAVLQVQAGLGALVGLQAGKHWKPEKWNYVRKQGDPDRDVIVTSWIREISYMYVT